jgi:hypothetical protein
MNRYPDSLKMRAEKTARRKRLRVFLSHLALRPIRLARILHVCQLCDCPIREGDEYRDGGMCKRAHEFCFQAVAQEKF